MANDRPENKRIVFGKERPVTDDVAGVRTMAFPVNRSYRWMPVAAAGAEPADVPIVVAQAVLDRLGDHDSLSTGAAGYLLGRRCVTPDSRRAFVIVERLVWADGAELTKRAWTSLANELRESDETLLGWFQARAGELASLGDEAAALTHERFADAWMCALMIDPAAGTAAFYGRRQGTLDVRVPLEFSELLTGATQATSQRWSGYTCVDAATGAVSTPPRRPLGSVEERGTAALDAASAFPDGAHSQPFPFARTFHWISAGAGERSDHPVAILLSQEVMLGTTQAVSKSLDIEIGGFLLGNCYRCPNTQREFIIIDQFAPAQFTEATNVSLSFTADAWSKFSDELTGKYLGKTLVGWYHSHPRMGIFLSQWDVKMHDENFAGAWMTALVIDPEKMVAGFFARRGGVLDGRHPVDFYEYADFEVDGVLESAMPWNGYNCRHSQTGAPLHPRRASFPLAEAAAPPALHTARDVHTRERAAAPSPPPRPASRMNLTAVAAIAVATVAVGYAGVQQWRSGPDTVAVTAGTPQPPPVSAPVTSTPAPPPIAPAVSLTPFAWSVSGKPGSRQLVITLLLQNQPADKPPTRAKFVTPKGVPVVGADFKPLSPTLTQVTLRSKATQLAERRALGELLATLQKGDAAVKLALTDKAGVELVTGELTLAAAQKGAKVTDAKLAEAAAKQASPTPAPDPKRAPAVTSGTTIGDESPAGGAGQVLTPAPQVNNATPFVPGGGAAPVNPAADPTPPPSPSLSPPPPTTPLAPEGPKTTPDVHDKIDRPATPSPAELEREPRRAPREEPSLRITDRKKATELIKKLADRLEDLDECASKSAAKKKLAKPDWDVKACGRNVFSAGNFLYRFFRELGLEKQYPNLSPDKLLKDSPKTTAEVQGLVGQIRALHDKLRKDNPEAK